MQARRFFVATADQEYFPSLFGLLAEIFHCEYCW
jgi:hypothetical protein